MNSGDSAVPATTSVRCLPLMSASSVAPGLQPARLREAFGDQRLDAAVGAHAAVRGVERPAAARR